MPTRRREMMENRGLTGLRELNKHMINVTQPALTTHIHPDAMEICFLYRGRQVYQVGGQDYRLRGMDVFFTYPDEEHSTGGNPEEKSELYYLIVDCVHKKTQFLGVNDPAVAYIPEALLAMPHRLFRGSEKLHALWEEIYTLLDSDHPLKDVLVRQRAVDLFLEIIYCANHTSWQSTEDIQSAAKYISEHTTEDITLPMLAEQYGLSLARFKAKFRQQMGMPPGEYIMRERIRTAQEMLRQGMGITDVAYSLNFSSSQYFSTCFRRFYGMTPGAFCLGERMRERARRENGEPEA